MSFKFCTITDMSELGRRSSGLNTRDHPPCKDSPDIIPPSTNVPTPAHAHAHMPPHPLSPDERSLRTASRGNPDFIATVLVSSYTVRRYPSLRATLCHYHHHRFIHSVLWCLYIGRPLGLPSLRGREIKTSFCWKDRDGYS